jgi:biopolymer transport protein ExbD
MSRRRKKNEQIDELNLKPAMNLILILIPLLLSAMEAVKIAVINVATPQIGPSSTASAPDQKPEEKPLKLTIALTDRGITIFAKDSVIENKDDPLGPTLPKIDGEESEGGKLVKTKVYDFDGLQKILKDIKNENPTEENVIIQGEATTKYKYIINVMDAAREVKEGDKHKPLFPNVILSAGVA